MSTLNCWNELDRDKDKIYDHKQSATTRTWHTPCPCVEQRQHADTGREFASGLRLTRATRTNIYVRGCTRQRQIYKNHKICSLTTQISLTKMHRYRSVQVQQGQVDWDEEFAWVTMSWSVIALWWLTVDERRWIYVTTYGERLAFKTMVNDYLNLNKFNESQNF